MIPELLAELEEELPASNGTKTTLYALQLWGAVKANLVVLSVHGRPFLGLVLVLKADALVCLGDLSRNVLPLLRAEILGDYP